VPRCLSRGFASEGDLGVTQAQRNPAGRKPTCGRPRWIGQSPVVEAWRSTATVSRLWGGAKRMCQRRERGGTPYGTQTKAGVEDLCGIVCVRLGKVGLGYGMLCWVG
jgi:hypothetical protein